MKNFDIWNHEKQILDDKKVRNFYINSREIWFTKMGENIGFEENGKKDFLRPVLVIKKIENLFLTVALSSKGKENNIFYHEIKKVEFNENNQKYKDDSFIILSQVKVMDKRRFTEKMGKVKKEEFEHIKEKLKKLLF